MQRNKKKIKPTRIYQSKKRKKYTIEDIFKLIGVETENNLKIYDKNNLTKEIKKLIKQIKKF
jgi:hypothetical protein